MFNRTLCHMVSQWTALHPATTLHVQQCFRVTLKRSQPIAPHPTHWRRSASCFAPHTTPCSTAPPPLCPTQPLIFPKTTKINSYNCCGGATACLGSCGMALLLTPIGVCCPHQLYPTYNLRLDSDSVQFDSAVNDCCCHIANTKKTVRDHPGPDGPLCPLCSRLGIAQAVPARRSDFRPGRCTLR